MKKQLLILTIVFLVNACSKEPSVKDGHLITVEAKESSNALFYSGSIAPLNTTVVESPADGVVVDMPFQYGDSVKTGQLLFLLSSSKFLSDYKTALMQYIKAKNDFNSSEAQQKEAEFLHKNLLISDDDYKMKHSNFYAAQLVLLQAKDTLQNLLQQTDIKDINLYQLTIADIDKITEAMHLRMSAENLRVISPVNGVFLTASKNEDENKKILKGDTLKQGDVLAMIGDMTGISVSIKVNELTVNQLKVGQKVKVSGIAFNDILQGEIVRVDRQGEAVNGSLPSFAVKVAVPTLNPAERETIHVGMSAKVEIDIHQTGKIMIPITSLSEENGESFAKVYDQQQNKIVNIAVKTGKTTMNEVEILTGLKSGDRLVIPH